MLIKFLSWCCGVNIPKLLAENICLRNELDEYLNRYIKLELENCALKKEKIKADKYIEKDPLISNEDKLKSGL